MFHRTMVFLGGSLGNFSWICDGELNLGSSCTQRTIIDGINLLFFSVFCLSLILGSIRKNRNSFSNGRDWISVVVSVSCTLISIAYLGSGLWYQLSADGELEHVSWLVFLVRGLVWISLAASLLVTKSKWIRGLSIVWWVSFFLLVSALNVRILAGGLAFQVLDLLSWPANFLLLCCAFKNLRSFASQIPHKSLSDPLLGEKEEKKNQSKLRHSSFFCKLTFSWISPLLKLGYTRPLQLENIPSLIPEDEANVAYQKFQDAWHFYLRGESSNNTKNLVTETLAKVYSKENIIIAIYALLRTIAVTVLPLWLYFFVNYSNLEEQNLYQGLAAIGSLVLIKLVESLSQRHYFFLSRQSGLRMRSALMVAIYQKQLKLSSLGRKRHSTGEIVNYIAVDAYRMGEFPWWFHYTWSLFLQLFLSIPLFFGVVGFGAVTALVPMFISGILNVPFARFLQKCQTRVMVAQDERLRATSEILNSMKIIKLQSWEETFKKVIETRRDEEFKWLAKAQLTKAFGTFLYWMSPTIIPSFIFLGCALFNSAPLDAGTIFTVLTALRCLAEPVRAIPECLSVMIQAKVSFDRINAFLLDDELKNDCERTATERSDKCIIIREGKFSWDADLATATLREANLEVRWGQKIAVCGPVGAGKSSLLYAILGEIPKTAGSVSISGSIAYVSQASWIQSGTVRDNILFGKPMDQVKYEKAVKACALDKDIDSFHHGDLTEIGQRGLNMSGGQKQRLQLARAVYNDADIYLLDDPFSAVDAHTAAILFHDCVMAALERKTVILVTHQVEFLSAVDRIMVMEDGKVTQSGTYEELLEAGTAFEQLVNAHKDAVTALGTSSNESQIESTNAGMVLPQESNVSSPDKEGIDVEYFSKGVPPVQLTEEEEKVFGDVGLKTFLDYITVSNGTLNLCLSVLAQSGFVVLQAASTYWLALAIQIPQIDIGVMIGVYTIISMSSAFFVYLRSLFTAHLGLNGSKNFFSNFTNAIFKAPMLFFDSTPAGRILTRASSDLSVLDFDITFAFSFAMSPLIELMAIIGIMISVTWQVLIVTIITMAASKYVQGYYLASARELTRINGTTKAPVMNYASETSQGVIAIRAFQMAQRFFHNFLELVDTDAVLFFHVNAATEWLVLRIEALQNITLFTAAFLLLLLPKGYVPPGLVGLSLSYALSLTGSQVFMTRWYCNLSNYLVSVERIKQFMHIQPEPPAIVEDNRPPTSWPSKGRIELQELKIKYRPNAPLVLKGISCTFKEGHRVGVVGRTGSGKTTLISALFRLVEPASGRILVDGVDICSMGLKDLRMKLSIIPQEPTLFRGSVRTNLDPLGVHSDQEIWEALEKCQLKATIGSLPNLLDSLVSDEGENWSVGQRQLFCLGRVLLRRNRILVLDEATASIDSATDATLQRIIRQEFSGCTVITVAHRVPTVIDSDMVMVLSYGKLVEYDEPTKLMEMNSSFSKLVAEYWASCKRHSYQTINSLP